MKTPLSSRELSPNARIALIEFLEAFWDALETADDLNAKEKGRALFATDIDITFFALAMKSIHEEMLRVAESNVDIPSREFAEHIVGLCEIARKMRLRSS